MSTASTSPPRTDRSTGRGYVWLGIALCLIGVGLVVAQIVALKILVVPWYSPALATLGALLLLVAVARRHGVFRVIVLVLVAAFAGFQWFFLVSLMKLPEYTGPAQAGKPFPAFQAALADGRPFTDADLRDGSRTVLVFFRGRW